MQAGGRAGGGGGGGMDPSHLVPEAGQGRGTPGRQDLWRLQLQLLQGWRKRRRRRRQCWRLGLSTQLHTHAHKMDEWAIRCRMRGARSKRGGRIHILNICPNNKIKEETLKAPKRQELVLKASEIRNTKLCFCFNP